MDREAYLLTAHDKGSGLERGGLHCGLLSVTKLIAGVSHQQRGFPNSTYMTNGIQAILVPCNTSGPKIP